MTQFDDIKAKLKSLAQYSQSDASSEIFDAWYSIAKQYAGGTLEEGMVAIVNATMEALDIMLTTYDSFKLRDPSSDIYAARELIRNAEKIFEVFATKPKFSAIITDVQGQCIWQWLCTVGVQVLEVLAYNDTVDEGLRSDAFGAIVGLNQLHVHIKHHPNNEEKRIEVGELILNYDVLARYVAFPYVESVLRSAALETLIACSDNGNNPAAVVALAKVAIDAFGVGPIWDMGGLVCSEVITILVARVRAISSNNKHLLLAKAILVSMYEGAVNGSTKHPVRFDMRSNESEICVLLDACLSTLSEPHEEEYSETLNDFPDDAVHSIEYLLCIQPTSIRLLRILLSINSFKLLRTVVSCSHVYNETCWINELLPFARIKIALMSNSGVSGNQYEQEIIDLVRECCRLHYLNIDRNPSQKLGEDLFVTVTQAIRHGYFETERFTEVLAIIVRFHYARNENTITKWVLMLFLPSVCTTLKTYRAIAEAVLIISGLQQSSISVSQSSQDISTILASDMCLLLSSLRSNSADLFWKELCLNYQEYIVHQQPAITKLLSSIQMEISQFQSKGCFPIDRFISLTDLLHAISMIVSTQDAPLLVRICIQIIELGTYSTALEFEDTIVHTLKQITDTNTFTTNEIEDTISICGPRCRCYMATLMPQLFLEDIDPIVRQYSLKAILTREELIQMYGSDIIRSLYWINKPMSVPDDSSIELKIDQLALSLEAVPVLAKLAVLSPPYVAESVIKLLNTASIFCINDPLNEPTTIIAQLDYVAKYVPRSMLIQFVLAASGLAVLPLLMHLSREWQAVVKSTLSSGYIMKEDTFISVKNKYVHYPRFHCKVKYTITDQGSSTLLELQKSQDICLVPRHRNQVHQSIKVQFENGDYMKALRIASSMKSWYPEDYSLANVASYVSDTIFPEVQTHLLPQPMKSIDKLGTSQYQSIDLNNFTRFFRTMNQIKLLFPFESEYCFQISHRIEEFVTAKILDLLHTSGEEACKNWMEMYGIDSKAYLATFQHYHTINSNSHTITATTTKTRTSADNKKNHLLLASQYSQLNLNQNTENYSVYRDFNLSITQSLPTHLEAINTQISSVLNGAKSVDNSVLDALLLSQIQTDTSTTININTNHKSNQRRNNKTHE